MGFVQAIPVAIKVATTLTDGYRYVRDHPDEVRQAIDDVSRAAAAAKRFAGDARDHLGVDDTIARAKRTAENARLKATSAASALRGKPQVDPEVLKAEQEAAKAIAKIRQALLESADLRTTIPRLVERLDSTDPAELAESMRILDAPACFALATYPKFDLDKDLTDYHGVYVGKAEVAGDGIATAISRAGNPDVYADIKYKQNVVIFVFNCPLEELDQHYEALVEALGADNSYNMPIA